MFKLIKSTDWTSSTTGAKGTTLVVAYKGRVFTINQEDFPNIKIDATKKTVVLGDKPVVVREPYIDALGVSKVGLRLKPAIDLDLADF